MSNHKTLKDCYMSDARNYEQRLREEAIKDIKELLRTKEFLEIFGCEVEPLIEYIKWKFNVEEEDLK